MTAGGDPSSTLVVSATRAEARYVPAGLRVVITGIGKVRAATALSEALAGAGPPVSRVVNIGTVGALHDRYTGLFVPSVVIEHDITSAVFQEMGYPLVDRWEIPGGDGTVLASGDTFVTDPVRRADLARNADLVDMEGCAIAYVATYFGVPCRLVKAVTDAADASATAWPSRIDAAARRLGEWLETNF